MRIAWKPLGWGIFVLLMFVLLLGVLALHFLWREALQQNGIEELEWQGLDVSLSSVSVHELTLTQAQSGRDIALHARKLTLDWRWGEGWQPQLTALTAGHVKLNWHTKPEEQSIPAPEKPTQWPPQLPAWLPSKVAIQQFEASLPCEAGQCSLAGSLSITGSQIDPPINSSSSTSLVTNAKLPIEANVTLNHDGHQVSVLAHLDGAWDGALSFSAELAIDDIRYLSANSSYSPENANSLVSWQGSVDMPELPQADWLLAWLQTWQNIPLEQWPAQPEKGSAKASWQLQGPKVEDFLAQATGRVNVQARVPQPWPAPRLGKLSGNVELALEANQGQWQPETLKADLKLNHPAEWIKKLPQLMRPESLTLSVRPGAPMPPIPSGFSAAKVSTEQNFLPLNVVLDSRGRADISMHSHLAIATKAPWMVQLGKTQLSAALPELKVAGWRLTKPKVKIAVTGWLNTTDADLKIGKPTVLDIDKAEPLSGEMQATGSEMLLKGLRADLAKTQLKASYRLEQGELDQFTLSGPVSLKAKQINHPQLLAQPWQFNSSLNSNLARTDITGVLKAGTGTAVNLDLDFPYQGPVTIEGKMRVSGEQEADALSRIFTAWPPLLTVSGGNISASATYNQPQNGAVQLAGKLVFADWSGTYDRTVWNKMNGSAELLLKNDRVSMTTPRLTIDEVNPGLPIGPVVVAGGYETPLAQLAAGRLTLEQASSGALGGEVKIQPGTWDLALAPVTIPVELSQLSLARLMKLYPADGLAGTGILSGTVPLLFDPATGIRVKGGRIDALKPGGRLKVTAERLKALASQSESMKLVAKALEDFRYSVLDSGIDYDEDGTLVLKLHLKGRSPKVGKDQPIVLNVNLEENIPALLTSLQLSGRVSDAVTERVKKMLQKREYNSDDLLE